MATQILIDSSDITQAAGMLHTIHTLLDGGIDHMQLGEFEGDDLCRWMSAVRACAHSGDAALSKALVLAEAAQAKERDKV